MTPEKQNNTVEGLKEILNKFESFSAIIERMTLFVRELSEKDVNLLA
ncbi:MAG: hypothetical protein LBQ59_05685 [Candidatus Peribacteria bacterium]|jgi:hypothetical protein|nr:hypothetical protein [Candidatus Peribacteria bacterium]